MRNDIESILVTEEEIAKISDRIAAEITRDYKDSDKKLVLICILKGSLMFTCELMKRIPILRTFRQRAIGSIARYLRRVLVAQE